ncbi:unnamed protein product [Cuscuta europaea]|uniref:Uncharacterized protein n=1 Tax=Cuscuta europaea TaxID=41803 RepID=A0A9P0ZXX9_CUSEU|nr:unnamed protein product [Cuscuta europaea]
MAEWTVAGEIGRRAKAQVDSDERILSVGVFQNGRTERSWEFRAEVEDGISAEREKLLLDIQVATDKMKEAILGTRLWDGEQPHVAEEREELPPTPTRCSETITLVGPSEAARPWNLRTRRSGNKHPNVVTATASSTALKRQRAKFSVSFTRREIEEGLVA